MNEEGIGGSVMLPGTARPADRFVHVSYYLQQAPKTSDRRAKQSQRCSGHFGLEPSQSAATLWRTVSDQKNRIYFFESTTSPDHILGFIGKVRVARRVLDPEAGLSGNPDLAEDVVARFKSAVPFNFLSPAKMMEFGHP